VGLRADARPGTAFVCHPSLIALTYFALTETLVVFLLAVWLNLVARPGLFSAWRRIGSSVLVLALLTITKPVFKFALLLCLLSCVIALVRRPRETKRCVVAATLGLVPVVVHLMVMLSVHGVFTLSQVGQLGRDRHLLPQVYSSENQGAGW
jgi:hypothetical protein